MGITIGIVIGIVMVILSFLFRDDLGVLRNLVLIWGTPLAIFLAVWRSIVAQKQVEATQAALLSDQYQRAVKMLESEQGFIRMGGIHTLRHIAVRHDEYRMEVEVLLANYGRNLDTSKAGEGEEWDMAAEAFIDISNDAAPSEFLPADRWWRRLRLWLKNLCKRSQNT